MRSRPSCTPISTSTPPMRPGTCTARCDRTARPGRRRLGRAGTVPIGARGDAARRLDLVKHIKIRSRLLSDFHGRPIDLRAGVILPRGFARSPTADTRCGSTSAATARGTPTSDAMMADGSGFRRAWMADDAPPMILIHLDGAGPLGDPYQVDSANHGPYGAAVTGELIPYVEGELPRHRPGRSPRARRRLDRRLGRPGLAGLLPRVFQRRLGLLPRQRRFPQLRA